MRTPLLLLAGLCALALPSCCSHCNGTGNIKTRAAGTAPCPYCGGDGGWSIIPGSGAENGI